MNLTRSVAIFNSGKIASFAEETGPLCYNSLGYFTQSGKREESVHEKRSLRWSLPELDEGFHINTPLRPRGFAGQRRALQINGGIE